MGFAKAFGLNMRRANEMYGMGLVWSTSFGRKRVSFSNMEFGDDDDCLSQTPLKRLLSRFICLFFVSKAIRAFDGQGKQWDSEMRMILAVSIMGLKRLMPQSERSSLTAKKLADVSIDLFASGSEDDFPKRGLWNNEIV